MLTEPIASDMKRLWLLFFLLVASAAGQAQDYLNGKLIDAQTNAQPIFYDRTQQSGGISSFQTIYKVLNGDKELLYTISITHDRPKTQLTISINTEGHGVKQSTVKYDRNECGLIFSNKGNSDTSYSINKPYNYLISFADATRDFPVLHKIKTPDGKQIELDPLSKFRLKKHNEIIRSFLVSAYISQKGKGQKSFENNFVGPDEIWGQAEAGITKPEVIVDTFNSHLFKMRDALYAKSSHLNDSMAVIRSVIEADMAKLLKNPQLEEHERRYSGKRKNGKYDGEGTFMTKGNLYEGIFSNGKFISGIVFIRKDSSEYCGRFDNDSMNGTGWLKFKNGGYLLGSFKNDILANGIILSNDKEGEIFFGGCVNNQKTGYGELVNAQGNYYYGEYLNGKLVKGYSKEVDQFGYATYSIIENGSKKMVDAEVAEDFFGAILSFKK
jgi:hypothetical protein